MDVFAELFPNVFVVEFAELLVIDAVQGDRGKGSGEDVGAMLPKARVVPSDGGGWD